jgi:inner membrane protein
MLNKLRESPLARVAGTSLLVLALQIPIRLIAGTIDERRTTRGEAIQEVTNTWGGAQELIGPVLSVPVIERISGKDGVHERSLGWHRFLPRTLSVTGSAATENRRRGIFDVPLYVAALHVEAGFALPDEKEILGANERLQWKGAVLSYGLSDPKSIRSSSGIAWEPGPGDEWLPFKTGLHAALPQLGIGPINVAFDLGLSGSGRLSMVPAGDDTVVQLTSPWPDPSFDGAWLPTTRTVSAAGFDATWRVLNLARTFPSHWMNSQIDGGRLSGSSFGVSFLSPVDTYRTNDRAVKYQLLFLGLTFVCFSLVELLGALRVHPMQYLLVGLALCLFYLLLLSLSEQIGFNRAYLIAAAAVVLLISAYLRAVLATRGRALAFGSFLSGLYGFLFVLLQVQDYALLVGSGGLFAALAGVMWLTRRLDWYALGPAGARLEKQ